MKNCVKLHFTNKDNELDKIEDFFIGGALLFEDNKITYQQGSKTYILDKSDYVYINPKVIEKNTKQYKSILPIFDLDSLKQNLECRCNIIRGELPYNIRLGIPLQVDTELLKVSILDIINNTPGVNNCTVLSQQLINSKLYLQLLIQSNFGELILTI